MAKILPLRCNACGNLVGSARVINEDEALMPVEGDMKLEQHKADCPVLAAFKDHNMTAYSMEIGPYTGPEIKGDTDGSN